VHTCRLSRQRSIAVAGLAALIMISTAGCTSVSPLEELQVELDRSGASKVPIGREGLAVSLHPRKQVFKKNEPVLIDVRLTNVTNSTQLPADINVYTEIQTDGLLLFLDVFRLDGVRKPAYQSLAREVGEETQLGELTRLFRMWLYSKWWMRTRSSGVSAGGRMPGAVSVSRPEDQDTVRVTCLFPLTSEGRCAKLM